MGFGDGTRVLLSKAVTLVKLYHQPLLPPLFLTLLPECLSFVPASLSSNEFESSAIDLLFFLFFTE